MHKLHQNPTPRCQCHCLLSAVTTKSSGATPQKPKASGSPLVICESTLQLMETDNGSAELH